MAYPHMGWERIPPRQGEKMHETLIGPDEARYCWDRGSHYVLHPDTPRPHDEQDIEGWSYRSDTNPDELQPARFDEMMGRAALPNPDLGLR
jgi:FlaA1/EpsC-like NDP-sugar epimerase